MRNRYHLNDSSANYGNPSGHNRNQLKQQSFMITTLKEEQNNSSTYGNSISARSKLEDHVPKDQKIRMKHGIENYLQVP